MIFVTHMEITPNPNALKYVLNETILSDGFCEYRSLEEAQGDNLAQALFSSYSVVKVFYAKNYLTIEKTSEVDWIDIENQIKDLINAHIETIEIKVQEKEKIDFGSHTDLVEEIEEILDETIRPGLAMDGGGIEVIGINDEMELTVLYSGACGSCPSAQSGTLIAIEKILKDTVNENITVKALDEQYF